jgi:integrase|tara:strand:+ start:153 stop:1430 length:1278 start_codon:yes stop_codon:yes gene_type:complete
MLTDIQIKNAKPKEKPYFISDFGNLSIVIMPTNHKIWQHRFSIYPNGKRNEKIRRGGQYPTMSIKEARAWRDNNNELLSQGITPPKKYDSIKQVSSDIPTFKEMFDEWHKFNSKQWSDNYSIDTQQRADMYLLPQLGKIDIDKIPLGMIRDLLLDIQATGKHDTVSKIKGIAKQVFDYAVDRDILEINKVLSLSTGLFIKKKEKHYAHAKTPQELKSLLLKIEQVSSGQSVKTALKLVPHLMLRPSEVVGLRWNEIDFDDMLITIPPERMKIKKKLHHVPLSNTTFEILTNLKKNSLDSPYCFPSPKNKSKPIGTESMLRAIRRVGVTADQFVIHGNRHTSATMIANYLPQYSDRVVDAQLHHEIKGVSGIYNRADYLEQRKLLMQDWSNYLDNLQGSKTDSKETLTIDATIEKLKANIDRLTKT